MTALRIQVSEQCKDLLDQLGVYEFDDRGQVEVKVGHRSLMHNIATIDIYTVDTVLPVHIVWYHEAISLNLPLKMAEWRRHISVLSVGGNFG